MPTSSTSGTSVTIADYSTAPANTSDATLPYVVDAGSILNIGTPIAVNRGTEQNEKTLEKVEHVQDKEEVIKYKVGYSLDVSSFIDSKGKKNYRIRAQNIHGADITSFGRMWDIEIPAEFMPEIIRIIGADLQKDEEW